MDVRRLRLFLAVVDHGTFTKAAAASYVSQPGLSKAVQELEREVGTALFDRTTQGVNLTSAGRALVPHARQVVRDVEAARAAVDGVRGLETGSIELACLPTLVPDPAASWIADYRRAHPGIRIQLAAPDDPQDLVSMVRNGVVEVGVSERPANPAGLVVLPAGTQTLVALLPPGAPPPEEPLPLTKLARWPMVVAPVGTSSRRILDEALARVKAELWVAVETAQREAIVPLVLSGAGATIVPSGVADAAARLGALAATTRPRLVRPIALVHRDGPLSPAAAAFRTLVVGGDAGVV
ncbi:MAG: LysR substrate-binding domain-containing protein [Actinomycetota bacterium]|jgi:LysR family transcriptional regulator, carnitine catabolism transcriptional activator